MRTTLNLSTIQASWERYALAWAIPALVAGLAGLVLLAVGSRRQYRMFRADQHEVEEIQKREADLHGLEVNIRRDLEKPAYAELLRQVRFVNSLIDAKQVSVTGLIAELVRFMPADARMSALALDTQNQELIARFTIMVKNEAALEAFLNKLEETPDFKDVTIVNQGFEEAGSQPGQVSVLCTARYLPGAAVSRPEEPNSHPAKAKTVPVAAKATPVAAKAAPR